MLAFTTLIGRTSRISFAQSTADILKIGQFELNRRLRQIQADTRWFDQHLTTEVPRRLREQEEQERAHAERLRQKQLRKQQQMQTVAGLQAMSPTQFEKAVGSLYVAKAWEVFCTPESGDRGIDLVLRKGKQKVAVQCKRYRKVVSERVIREFYGSFVGGFNRGILITTSDFSHRACDWASARKNISLVNGELLADWMNELEVIPVENFETWQERGSR